MLDSHSISQMFSALSHPTRVDVLLALLRRFNDGVTTGTLGETLSVAPSTLSHHLRELERGNVIERHIEGARTIIKPNAQALGDLAALMQSLCCVQDGA